MRKPCCDKEGINKGAWSNQEDKKLIDYIKTHGEGCWRSLPKAAGLDRCGKSCRLRWINYLRPDIKRGNFGQDEEDLIIKLHALLGNRWSLIAGRLPGRTDNEVKNYWNSRIRKKLIKMGIDPNNHRPNQNPNIGQAAQPLINPQTNNQRQPVSSAPPAPKSTGSANHACKTPLKSAHKDDRNGRPANSDAASCPEDENSAGSSDLNLELTIAFPSPDGVLKVVKEEIALQNESPMATEMKIVRDCEANSVPTLILF